MNASDLSNSLPELRGVIFDLDGVIVDSHAAHQTAWRTFLQTLGREVPQSELDFILDGRKRNDILRHFLGELTEEELTLHGQCKNRIFDQMQAEVAPVGGVIPLIHELRQNRVALAVATSASRSRTHATLAHHGIEECFRVVVTAEDVISGKPDPAVYRLAAHKLGEPTETLLAIEDAISGVQAAIGAGLLCLAVASHQSRLSLLAAGACDAVPDFTQISVWELMRMHQGCSVGLK